MRAKASSKKGFTLVELLISVAIFVAMTVLLIAKYGNFNQSVLLTNLIYDVALVVRTAQTFGLSVANSADQSSDAAFGSAYGVDFSTVATPLGSDPEQPGDTRVILFADTESGTVGTSGVYSPSLDAHQNTYNVTRGAKVTYLCVGTEGDCLVPDASNATQVDITFKRPDPTAVICYRNESIPLPSCGDSVVGNPIQYAKIVIVGTDGSPRTLEVFRNGQVSIVQ